MGDVGAKLQPFGVVVGHEARRRDVGIVRGLDAEGGEEGFGFAGFFLFAAVLNVVDQQIGEGVGLEAGKAVMKRVLAAAAMHPAVPLAVVVLVSGPFLKAAAFVPDR